jgi:hypothetical protein
MDYFLFCFLPIKKNILTWSYNGGQNQPHISISSQRTTTDISLEDENM